MEVFANAAGVPGLTYVRNCITVAEEAALLAAINAAPWDTTLARRVQHYGYRYDYKRAKAPEQIGPLPEWAEVPIANLRRGGALPWNAPEQLIVNEYAPGQGIAAHTDHVRQFADGIISVSLGSAVAMEFAPKGAAAGAPVSLCLEPRSAVILTGPARYQWTHEIRKRKRDRQAAVVEGDPMNIVRARRVSVTYRRLAR